MKILWTYHKKTEDREPHSHWKAQGKRDKKKRVGKYQKGTTKWFRKERQLMRLEVSGAVQNGES